MAKLSECKDNFKSIFELVKFQITIFGQWSYPVWPSTPVRPPSELYNFGAKSPQLQYKLEGLWNISFPCSLSKIMSNKEGKGTSSMHTSTIIKLLLMDMENSITVGEMPTHLFVESYIIICLWISNLLLHFLPLIHLSSGKWDTKHKIENHKTSGGCISLIVFTVLPLLIFYWIIFTHCP